MIDSSSGDPEIIDLEPIDSKYDAEGNCLTYTKMGDTTFGSDGSVFTQMGDFSTDGSTRMGNTATGLGAVFNEPKQSRFGFDSEDADKW